MAGANPKSKNGPKRAAGKRALPAEAAAKMRGAGDGTLSAENVQLVTKQVIKGLPRTPGGAIGIRDVALAVEGKLPGATLDQIHKAVLKVANFYPNDDPQNKSEWMQRNMPFAWHGGDAPRVYVFPRDD